MSKDYATAVKLDDITGMQVGTIEGIVESIDQGIPVGLARTPYLRDQIAAELSRKFPIFTYRSERLEDGFAIYAHYPEDLSADESNSTQSMSASLLCKTYDER